MRRHIELDDQPSAGLPGGILGLMQPVGGDTNNVKSPDLIRNALNKVDRVGTKGDTQFKKCMEVLEPHIDVRASDIVIKKVEYGIRFFVYMDIVLILIQCQILDDHVSDPSQI